MHAGIRPRLLVLLSCGWSVRNYVRSGLLDRLLAVAEVTVMLPPGDAPFEAELHERRCDVRPLGPTSVPSRLMALEFVLVHAYNMRLGLWHPSFWRWSAEQEPSWKRPFLEMLRLAAAVARHEPIYQTGRELQRRWLSALPALKPYERALQELQPDLVLSTNPFRPDQLAPALAAGRLGIPTATSIVSWDNLSYKGLPPVPFTHYLVWSELMAQELLRGAPQLDRRQAHVTGTPQFDFHLSEQLRWSREQFFARIGGHPARPLLAYAAASPLTLPEEPEIVRLLWQAIDRGEIDGNPQLLVRVHPHDPTDRFERLRRECPGMLLARPWPPLHSNGLSWFNPSQDDLALLSNTIRHADVGISAFSTVALDTAVLDKPAVCVTFSTRPRSAAAVYLRAAPTYGHTKYLADSGAIRLADGPDELVAAVNASLRNPEDGRLARRELVARVCGPVDGRAAERVLECLLAAARTARGRMAVAGNRADGEDERLLRPADRRDGGGERARGRAAHEANYP